MNISLALTCRGVTREIGLPFGYVNAMLVRLITLRTGCLYPAGPFF